MPYVAIMWRLAMNATSLVTRAASSTVFSLFANAVRLHPGRIALEDDTRTSTYAELGVRVDRTAALLARMGVQRGDRVAILSENRSEYIEVQLALARLGAIGG